MEIAQKMEQKAEHLRHVRVKGDAEAKYEAWREKVRQWIKPGQTVDTIVYGTGTVKKVNKKTATVHIVRSESWQFDVNVDLYCLKLIN